MKVNYKKNKNINCPATPAVFYWQN